MRRFCLTLGLLLLAACRESPSVAKPDAAVAIPDAAVAAADAVPDAAVAVPVDPCPKGATYFACGCGCCGGPEGAKRQCIDKDKGESLASIQARDRAFHMNPNCKMMGCALGVLYECCD